MFRMVNWHNVRISGSKNPHIGQEIVRDSPKVNALYDMLYDCVVEPPSPPSRQSPWLFVYPYMLKQITFPQVEHMQPDILLQQDDAPLTGPQSLGALWMIYYQDRWIGLGDPLPTPSKLSAYTFVLC